MNKQEPAVDVLVIQISAINVGPAMQSLPCTYCNARQTRESRLFGMLDLMCAMTSLSAHFVMVDVRLTGCSQFNITFPFPESKLAVQTWTDVERSTDPWAIPLSTFHEFMYPILNLKLYLRPINQLPRFISQCAAVFQQPLAD